MAVSGDEEILGLQVPVDDALLVGSGEALSHLQRVVHGLLLGDRTCIEFPAQRLAFQKLHDGVRDALVRSEVEDREDVRMGERRDRLRLALEPGQRVGIGRDGLREDLDRDVPVQLLIPCPVHLPHPARAQRREDLVGAGGNCHRITTTRFYVAMVCPARRLGALRASPPRESDVTSRKGHAAVSPA